MRFADPLALALLPLAVLVLWWRWPRARRPPHPALALPTLPFLTGVARSARERWLPLPVALRALAVTLLIVALARPRAPGEPRQLDVRGRNIVLTLDISSSMKGVDFHPGNRLEVAKRVLGDFVRRRQGDFLGLVVFANRPLLQAPLTTDDRALLTLLDRADIGLLPDGTAIGTALAMGANQLKDLPRGSGVIVLLTDGGNNTGAPDPVTAARIARALGIRIYAIGVSAPGPPAPPTPLERDRWWRGQGLAYGETPATLTTRDEQMLRQIATVSGGAYYRATDARGLSAIMGEIDRIEKGALTLREVRGYHEYGPPLVLAGFLLLALELALRTTWLRTAP
jgi:Ca-activated chloride channel family protein